MKYIDGKPLWVFLALSNVKTRKGAMILTWSSFILTIYCFPWVMFLGENEWVKKLFLIDDWSWFVMMLPMSFWYLLSVRWMDNHGWS